MAQKLLLLGSKRGCHYLHGLLLLALIATAAAWKPSGPLAIWTFDECGSPTVRDAVAGVMGNLGAQAKLTRCSGRCVLSVSDTNCDHSFTGSPGKTGCDDIKKGSVMSISPVPKVIDFGNRKGFSVSAWVYLERYGDFPSVVAARHYGGDQFGLVVGRFGVSDTSSAIFFVGFECKAIKGENCKDRDTGVRVEAVGSKVPLRKWTHLMGTFDQNLLEVYMNGKRVARQLLPQEYQNTGANTSPEKLFIGGYPAWNQLNGQIDCVALYKTGLSERDVLKQYRQQKPNCGCTGSEPTPTQGGFEPLPYYDTVGAKYSPDVVLVKPDSKFISCDERSIIMSTEQAAGLKVGSVLAGQVTSTTDPATATDPCAMLARKVVKLQPVGDTVTVLTEPASLLDILLEADIDTTQDVISRASRDGAPAPAEHRNSTSDVKPTAALGKITFEAPDLPYKAVTQPYISMQPIHTASVTVGVAIKIAPPDGFFDTVFSRMRRIAFAVRQEETWGLKITLGVKQSVEIFKEYDFFEDLGIDIPVVVFPCLPAPLTALMCRLSFTPKLKAALSLFTDATVAVTLSPSVTAVQETMVGYDASKGLFMDMPPVFVHGDLEKQVEFGGCNAGVDLAFAGGLGWILGIGPELGKNKFFDTDPGDILLVNFPYFEWKNPLKVEISNRPFSNDDGTTCQMCNQACPRGKLSYSPYINIGVKVEPDGVVKSFMKKLDMKTELSYLAPAIPLPFGSPAICQELPFTLARGAQNLCCGESYVIDDVYQCGGVTPSPPTSPDPVIPSPSPSLPNSPSPTVPSSPDPSLGRFTWVTPGKTTTGRSQTCSEACGAIGEGWRPVNGGSKVWALCAGLIDMPNGLGRQWLTGVSSSYLYYCQIKCATTPCYEVEAADGLHQGGKAGYPVLAGTSNNFNPPHQHSGYKPPYKCACTSCNGTFKKCESMYWKKPEAAGGCPVTVIPPQNSEDFPSIVFSKICRSTKDPTVMGYEEQGCGSTDHTATLELWCPSD